MRSVFKPRQYSFQSSRINPTEKIINSLNTRRENNLSVKFDDGFDYNSKKLPDCLLRA